jgi:hypothetical protein
MQTLGELLTEALTRARREEPKGQRSGPVWRGMLPRNHEKASAMAARPARKPTGERLAGHAHDLVAVTDASGDAATVVCAVPGCAHRVRAIL